MAVVSVFGGKVWSQV